MRDYISHDFGNHAVYRQEKKIKWVVFITLIMHLRLLLHAIARFSKPPL